MSRDGNGVYSLVVNSWNPAVDGNAATTVDWQALIDDVAAALTQSVSSDGQTPMTGDLNMNGNRIESLAAGTSTTDAANVGQIYNQGTEQDVASAATTDIGIVNTNFIRITGTTTISSLGTNYRGPRFVRFSDALILTHNASTLILPGGANITTAAGDRAIFVPKGNPSDGWNCVVYQYASGQKITGNLTITGQLNVDATYLEDGTTPVYRFIDETIFTTSDTWTPNAATRYYEVRIIPAGGAGGGAPAISSAASSSAGSGGGSGSPAYHSSTTIPPSVTITLGAAGTGVAGAAGNAGGTTTFVGTGVNISCPGGLGGNPAAGSNTAVTTAARCQSSAVSTGATINGRGTPGESGWRDSNGSTVGRSYGGAGASTEYGVGGEATVSATATNAGNAATGYGAGGGGASLANDGAISRADQAGGSGSGAIVIVREYA